VVASDGVHAGYVASAIRDGSEFHALGVVLRAPGAT